MSAKYPLVCLALILLISACSTKKPIADPNLILEDANSFWEYKHQYVRLYEDFKALDNQLRPITKEAFLRTLLTGRYLPLRLQTQDTTKLYQLYPLPTEVDKTLKAVLLQWVGDEYEHYQVEGKPLPDYHLVDMDGKIYTKQTTAGKILVLKCWFVRCVACVAEMPNLNALKQRYKNRNDVVFVSLCSDPSDKVTAFLKKTKFDYATVPDQTAFVEDTLKIRSYPMHMVIKKQGLVVKKVDNYQALVYVLNKTL